MAGNMDNGLLLNKDMIDIVWGKSPIVIAIMDESGRFIYVNAMAQKFWEYTTDELLQKKWQQLTHPEDLATDAEMHLQLKNGDFEDGYYSMCKRYLTKSGRITWGSVTVHILRNINGERLFFLSQVVPFDAMHHTSNKVREILEQQNSRRNTGTASTVKKESESGGALQFFEKNRLVMLGAFAILSSIIIFMADFKYNQKRISDIEKRIEKIENGNNEMINSMETLKKLMEQSLKNRSPSP